MYTYDSTVNERNIKWDLFIKKIVKTKVCLIFTGSHFHDSISYNLTRIPILCVRYLHLKHNLIYDSFMYKILLKINSEFVHMSAMNLKDHDEL